MLPYDLVIHRGGAFRAHQWVLVDDENLPLRSADGLSIMSKVRRYAGDDTVLHTFAVRLVQLVLPDEYDDQPVIAAQIDAMSPAETAALTWDRGVYDILVAGNLLFPTSTVTAPAVVSR